MEDWLILALGISLAIIGGITAIKVVSLRQLDAESVKKTIALKDKYAKDLELENDELEAELKKWRGKANQAHQLPKVSGNYNLEGPDGLMAVVQDILPSLEGILPKEFRGLTRDPKALGFIGELVKQNPEKAKEFISKFVTKGSAQAEPESNTRDFNKIAV